MAGLLRRILNSGYAIVAVGAVGFLLVFSLQFVVETTRREAYTSLKTAQNAQATLNLLAKEIWRLRYWDNAPNPERGKIVEARGEILGRIASHRQALELYTKTLGEQDDYTNLSTQIDNYLVQSNETDRLWEEMGRWSNEFTSGALTSTIGPTEKALAATSHNSSIYVPLREAQLVQYQMLLAGQTRVRVLPDGENLAQIAGRVLKELPKAQFAPSLTADVRQAMESLARKDYIAQQLKLSAAIKTRNASIDALEGSLRGISLRLIKQQGAAGAGFEAARSQSLLVVSVGCIALGLLFVITSVTATRSMRRQAKLLQESERRFKDFASASSDTLVELDPDYNIIKTYHTNGAVDYDSERSVVGHPFFASRPDGKPSPLRVILDQRKSFRGYEAVLPSRTEKNRWRRVNGVPFYDENQKFAGFRLSVVNIAEQKALEEELQAKQALYEQLAEQVPGAVFVVRLGDDGKADLEYASPYFSNLTGYSTDEANELTRSGGTILSRDTLERSQEMRDKHPDGAVELKGTIKRKDGKIIPIIYSSRNIAPAPSGELRRLGMLIDLSELEAAEQAVQDRERQLTSILSNIGSAYFFSVTMGGGKIEPQFCSPGVETVLGYSPQEWCDLFKGGAASFALTAHPDDRKRIQAVFEQMALGDDPAQWEFQALNRRCRKDGRIINCMTRGRHIRLPDGRLLQEGMVIDVTLDLQRQEELIRLKTAVDAASESIAIWRKLDDVPGGQRELVYANKMAQQLLARTAPPAAADQWASVRKAPEPDLRLDDIDRAVDAKGRWSGLQQIMCNDGTSMLADITVTRIDGTTALHVVRDVTAIKLLETANEKARAELQDVVASLDFAGEGIVITHPLKEIVFANKSFAKWAAHGDPAEIIGKSMMDLLGETDPPLSQIAEEAAKVTARGEVFTTEATVTLRKNGSKRIMRWSTAPLSDGRWINISRDVTELRGLEFKRTRLDRSVAEIASRRDLGRMPPREIYEMILREISRTMDVRRASIWRMTTDNAALQSVLALHDGNIVAKFVTFERSTRELYFDELFKLRSIVINDVSAHPVTQSIHDGYYSRLGITSTLDVPILWQGALWGVICIEHVGPARTWDISEVTYATYVADFIVMTLERLARDEAQARIEYLFQENSSILSALDSTQERIIIEDAVGYVRYVNQAVADAWGSGSKAELLGRPFLSAFPLLQPYRRAMETEVLSTIQSNGSWSGQLLLTRPNGESAYVDIHVMQLPDKGLLYTAEDVTEKRKHEQREQQLKTQLIEAQKMESIGRLAGGVAHDFNNIIAAVRAFASLVSSEVQTGTKAKTYADRIINTCDRAADLVRQILLFSRASRAELKPTSIGDVIEEVTAYLRASIPASITLDIQRPERDAIVNGNAAQLVQVLMNLGLNARDAIGERPGRIQIFSEERVLSDREVSEYKPGLTMANTRRTDGVVVHQYVVGAPLTDQRYLCVTVRDDGPGMSGITVERMFEPFFTTKEKARGTGLGLPVVAAVVAAHSGFIVVTTQQGRGCRFNAYLPMSRHAVDDGADLLPRPDLEHLKGTERVLLVDDEADLADATALLLRKYGYDVAPLYFPRDALRIFEEDPTAWDVVITDQVMPAMKGLELITHLRKIRTDIPVILCTGFSDFATERNSKALGADAFFTKPVLPENLAQAIRQLRDEKVIA